MKSFFVAIASLAVVPGILALTMDTPTGVVKCQPILLNCREGQPPYFISMLPGGQPNAPALKQFDTSQTGQITWQVDLDGALSGQCRDSTGNTVYTDVINVQNSGSTCADSSAPAAGASSGSSAPAPGTSAPSAPAAGATTPTPSAPASSTSGSSARSSSTTSGSATRSADNSAATTSNAAVRMDGKAFGLAGLFGLVGAAALF